MVLRFLASNGFIGVGFGAAITFENVVMSPSRSVRAFNTLRARS